MDVHATDELPYHQAPTPFHVAGTSDVHFNDGYWFAAFSPTHFLAVGMRLHPNMNVIDGFASLATGGEQQAVRLSRPLHANYARTAVGPLEVAFTEPMRTVRVSLAESPIGLAFDLVFRCATEPFLKTPSRRYKSGHLMNDVLRYIQVGRASGTLTHDGERVDVRDWPFSRDHSWGIRSGMGPRTPHGGRSTDVAGRPDRRRFRLWVPFVLDGHCGFFHTHEDEHGTPIDVEGRIRLRNGTEVDVVRCEHALTHHPGTRYPSGGTITLTDARGHRRRYTLTPCGTPADVQGFGYHGGWHDGCSAGTYRGDDLVVEHDRYPSGTRLPPTGPPKVAAERRIGPSVFPCLVRCDDGPGAGASGMAQLEHSVLGTYRPYGFVGPA